MAANGKEIGFYDQRSLFGGAITCLLPPDAQDISEIRDIPDNQEVFCHIDTDQSIMVDILEYQSQVEGESAVRYHFEDISSSNEAMTKCEVLDIELIEDHLLTQCGSAWFLRGRQLVSKFNEGVEAQNVLGLAVALFRLPQYETDIVMTFNNPEWVSPSSSSYRAEQPTSSPWTYEMFTKCVKSLQLKSPETLFGE